VNVRRVETEADVERTADRAPCTACRKPHPLIGLQRAIGNRAVGALIARAPADEAEVAPRLEARVDAARTTGRRLDGAVRAQMESAFGEDFGGVRVHAGGEADSLNRAFSSRAFATGRDVFFRAGEYQPGTSQGRELIAHELAHVVQQGGADVRGKLTLGSATDPAESDADEAARAVSRAEVEGPTEDDEENARGS
jgi:hypothetical protein